MGREVFPDAKLPSWAAGVYVSVDKLSLIRTGDPARFAQRLLNHEVIHAWTDEHFDLDPQNDVESLDLLP